MLSIRKFLDRTSQNPIKKVLLRLSTTILFVTLIEKTLVLLFEGNTSNVLTFTQSDSFIIMIFSTQGIIVASIILIGLFLMDIIKNKG